MDSGIEKVEVGNGRTLVAGCGVRKVEGNVVAVDLSRDFARRYRKAHPEASVVVADIAHLPFRDGVFSSIEFWNVLEHVVEKPPLVAELARTARPGAPLNFSAGLRKCDRLLGRISRTYRRLVTEGWHRPSTDAAVYLDMLARHFDVDDVRYPGTAYVFLVEGLLDFYGVTITEAGEYVGKGADRVLDLARRWEPLFHSLFRWLKRYFAEHFSQTMEVRARRKERRLCAATDGGGPGW